MLGGGTFSSQNKILPGSYINFISKAKASADLSDRGIVTMPLSLDWGATDEVVEITSSDFQKYAQKIFGYDYSDDKLKGLRDLFLNAQTLYAYRLNGAGNKAANKFATANCSGTRGNDIKISIQKNVDDQTRYDVKTYLGTILVDNQTVKTSANLVDNDYITFKKDSTLEVTAGIALTGGTNSDVTGESYQKYFDKIESYNFNVMGIVTTDEAIKRLATAFCKRMRDDVGAKFQVVLYNYEADYEGVINVANKVTTDSNFDESAIVYFVTGIEAGCAINKSCLNSVYNGEFEVNTDYTQIDLEDGIKSGRLMLHNVGTEVRILEDINSLVTISEAKGEIFKENQTIRIIDQIANDIANLFNTKYLGNIPNDESGRISLWSDIVKHHEQLQELRAIEDFSDEDVTVEIGANRKTVVVTDNVTVINAMSQLYMTVEVG